MHQEKFHISINTSPRAAQSWNKTISKFRAFLPVILHFATKLFTAVPKFRRYWMRVPAAYKQTKNKINATTQITAGSCYREVCWKWHVGTNGQKATISNLSARSKLKNWPSPPSSCCLAGHREVHQEKFHISINTSPRAAQSWNKTILTFWAFCPWFFTLRLNYSQQCQNFGVTECGCQRPTSKPKIKSMRPLQSQLGHVIERYVESDTWAQMGKKRQFLTFLPVRSSRTDHRHPHLVV